MIMEKGWIWLIGLVAIFFSCYDTELDATEIASDSDNEYLLGSSLDGLALDPYTIIGITPDSDGWNVIVDYSGGCEEHQFYAVWNEEWAESFPMQTTFELGHVGNNDPCDAVIRDTVRVEFDNLFNNSYPQEGAIVTLRQSVTRNTISVHPGLADIAQGNFCNINAKLVGTPCGTGLWGNKWLKVQDSVDFHNQVWLQPVTNTAAISLNVPEEGDYDVGITLLFGYQFQIENSICQALPEGTIIPIAINCLDKD